jgi:hypothetical protein
MREERGDDLSNLVIIFLDFNKKIIFTSCFMMLISTLMCARSGGGGFIAAVHFFLPQSYLLFSARSRRRFSSAS